MKVVGAGVGLELGGRGRIADANVQIRELEVLRLDADLHAPPEAVGLAEMFVDDYRAVPANGDHLRLPPCSNKTAPQIRHAIDRFLSMEAVPAASEAVAVKEGQLFRLLSALRAAHERIHNEAQGVA